MVIGNGERSRAGMPEVIVSSFYRVDERTRVASSIRMETKFQKSPEHVPLSFPLTSPHRL